MRGHQADAPSKPEPIFLAFYGSEREFDQMALIGRRSLSRRGHETNSILGRSAPPDPKCAGGFVCPASNPCLPPADLGPATILHASDQQVVTCMEVPARPAAAPAFPQCGPGGIFEPGLARLLSWRRRKAVAAAAHHPTVPFEEPEPISRRRFPPMPQPCGRFLPGIHHRFSIQRRVFPIWPSKASTCRRMTAASSASARDALGF